jgi:predicted metal-dependent phosphoesterase TrpH
MLLDLHLHTRFSPDCLSAPDDVLSAAKQKGLSGIAVTDHDELQGAFEVRDRNRDASFEVIVGCEITTEAGDIIGLFLKERVKSRRPLDVIGEIHAQGGLALLPHPFHRRPPREEIVRAVDLLEVFNARSSPEENRRAEELATRTGKPAVCGSDAHFPSDIGTCKVFVEGTDTRAALLHGTRVLNRAYSPRYRTSASQVIKAWRHGRYLDIPKYSASVIRRFLQRPWWYA